MQTLKPNGAAAPAPAPAPPSAAPAVATEKPASSAVTVESTPAAQPAGGITATFNNAVHFVQSLMPWHHEDVQTGVSREYDAHEHMLTLQELADSLSTSLNFDDLTASKGLTAAFASERLASEGHNRLTPPKEKPEIVKFLEEFGNLFMVLLMVAGLFTARYA